jgi:hypothetical protein
MHATRTPDQHYHRLVPSHPDALDPGEDLIRRRDPDGLARTSLNLPNHAAP